jgi:hypothetical protein
LKCHGCRKSIQPNQSDQQTLWVSLVTSDVSK